MGMCCKTRCFLTCKLIDAQQYLMIHYLPVTY